MTTPEPNIMPEPKLPISIDPRALAQALFDLNPRRAQFIGALLTRRKSNP